MTPVIPDTSSASSASSTTPTTTPATNKRPALDEYYKQWEKKAAAMHAKSAQVDWSKVDLSKLKPSDIGVMVGPPMTEEQFKEYRKRQATAPVVIRK